MNLIEKLNHVNQSVNENFQYFRDEKDTWQTPDETMERGGGDCEDLQLLKMHTLRILGISDDRMRLQRCFIIGKGDTPNEGHIVLVVDGEHVLDNRFDSVREKSKLDYMYTSQKYTYQEALAKKNLV